MTTYRINQKFRATAPDAEHRRPSDAVLRLAEMFGLGLDESREVTLYEDLDLEVQPGDVVYVTGPSGCGKSVLVRRLAEAILKRHPDARLADLAETDAPADRAVIDGLCDALGGAEGFPTALRLASTAGLADAFLLLRRPAELSDGQRWRLRLAHALAHLLGRAPERAQAQGLGSLGLGRGSPGAGNILVADELASTLDRACARAVAYRLRRLADSWGVTVLAASAHEDLIEDLAPDVLVRKEAGPEVRVRYARSARCSERRCSLLRDIRIERGTPADWKTLAPFHYRSHRAGATTDVFRMVYRAPRREPRAGAQGLKSLGLGPACAARSGARRDVLIGVIVYSRPPLSLAARNRATAGRYRLGTAGLAAGHLINRELRTISRVVIAPNWRGLGLARRLVAETLDQVGTPYVEALAAMGQVHPFFEQAGMTAYPQPPSAASERLRAALEQVGLERGDRRSAEALAEAIARLDGSERRLVDGEIRRWAASYLAAKNRRTNPKLSGQRMLELVARHLDSAPVYYLWRRSETPREPGAVGAETDRATTRPPQAQAQGLPA